MSEKAPNIDPERFMEWLEQSDVGEVREKGRKVLVNSPFEEDVKFHCALFPWGWKDKHEEKGRFRCFKSGESGNLYEFVMKVDNCTFGQAVKKIAEKGGWRPQKGRNEAPQEEKQRIESVDELHCDLRWPSGLVDLTEESDDPEIREAAAYMRGRMIDPKQFGLLYCTQDHRTGWPDKPFTQRLAGRVMIPYYGPDGMGIYWSARGTRKIHEPKYLEPHGADKPVDKEAALYCIDWSKVRNKNVLLVEGAIDVMSLHIAGIPAIGTQGSQLYALQASILRQLGVTPIYAYDRDKAGREGVIKANDVYRKPGFFVFAPEREDDPLDKKGHDWNSLLVAWGADRVRKYVLDRVAPLSDKAVFTIKRSLAA